MADPYSPARRKADEARYRVWCLARLIRAHEALRDRRDPEARQDRIALREAISALAREVRDDDPRRWAAWLRERRQSLAARKPAAR